MHRFLIPDVLLRFGQTEIGGAFILDTLLNRNRSLGSIPLPWYLILYCTRCDKL